jgi:type I restriction enzyme M protein
MPKNAKRRPDAFSNKFCRADDLSNEASVEQFFVVRLLADLGYADKEIKPKTSLSALKVGKGRKKEPYKPDFLIYGKQKPRWIIDAKSPDENPDDYVDQGAGYCLGVNQKYADNPVHYFMLTNGFLTRVYRWDEEQPVMSLRFGDFADDNTKYKSLRALLGADAARTGWTVKPKIAATGHKMTRPTMEEVKKTFTRCHRIIWKAEKVSPQAAFLRFAKILFVKLWEDRKLRDNAEYLTDIGRSEPLPADAVRFSTHWIEQQEAHEGNPIDRILFRQLVDTLEAEIEARKRKRIFEPDAQLDVSPGTVKRVVKELEHQYLFGIDEDLNGRMFEAFLVATMRGQELGQYFTPRSIVKLITRLGKPIASPGHIERVLDGCCGTGGFLIEVLTDMRRQVYENTSLTKAKRFELLDEVANEAIFGIDAGQDPPLVKIARINMYLHGDGGSRVYMADGLRKTPAPSGTDNTEGKQEVAELKKALEGDKKSGPLRFDLVLTNPPFSMDYAKTAPEEWDVLKDYQLRTWEGANRTSLRSAIMFIERYHDLLKPGGRLLTVIDDGVLGGRKMGFVRDYLRDRFIINGIISLHGDAFRRAGARTKTSILCVTKRRDDEDGAPEDQPDAFVYESRYIGIDDVPSKTPPSVAAKARQEAVEEMDKIVTAYEAYLVGKKGPWLVKAARLKERLDAKFLNPWSVDKLEPVWEKAGAETAMLGDIVEHIEEQVTIKPADTYTFLRITYAGYATAGEKRLGKEISYDWIGRASPGDIVVSNINAVNGATCVLPEKAKGHLITSEFTVLRVKDGVDVDPMYLWSVLRSPAVIAEWLSSSTGLGRHRVTWDLLKDQKVPLMPKAKRDQIAALNRKEYRLFEEMMATRESATDELAPLDLYGEIAKDKLARAKPPR